MFERFNAVPPSHVLPKQQNVREMEFYLRVFSVYGVLNILPSESTTPLCPIETPPENTPS